MPIEAYIDHARRLVIARGKGVFTDADVRAYQDEVWSLAEVAGYDELIDMTEVGKIEAPMPAGPAMQRVAAEAAAKDPPHREAKLAIVAPTMLGYGLARAYQHYRELEPQSRKEVGVFRTLADAAVFLGIDGLE